MSVPENLTTPKTVYFNDVDGTVVPYNSDAIHPYDLAAMRALDDHGVRRVHVTARPLSNMGNIFRQSGNTDVILDGGATIITDGEMHCKWLDPELTEEIVGTILPYAHFIGYNGQRSTKAHRDILRQQPAKESPSIFMTYEVEEGRREAIQSRLGYLALEFNPYHGSEKIHCVQIGLGNKESGTRWYQELRGLTAADCATIGDGEADLGPHATTSMRFVMGNAVPKLLESEYAYTRVGSVDEQGYAQSTAILLEHNLSFLG